LVQLPWTEALVNPSLRLGDMQQNKMPLRVSPLVAEMGESKTVQIFSKVSDMKSRGELVNGALCVGQPDFAPPPEVVQATAEAAAKGLTSYTGVTGTLELRTAICSYLSDKKSVQYAPDEVMVACGGKQAIFQAILALCQAGDEVLIPAPFWTSYPDIVKMSGAKPVIVQTLPEAGYALEPATLAASLTSQTRVLIICNPSNPTGNAMNRDQLEALAEVLRKPEYQHVYVMSDEIYERICFDGLQHVSFAALEGMRDRTLTINGFSKAFSMTGYRLGYLAAPAPIIKAATKVQSQITSCACSISQAAGIAALQSDPAYIDGKVVELQAKRNEALSLLLSIPGVTCPKPEGAFYLFPDVSSFFGRSTKAGEVIADANQLCLHLLGEYKVALVPGDAFGADKCVRISYAATLENIQDAITKLGFCLQALV